MTYLLLISLLFFILILICSLNRENFDFNMVNKDTPKSFTNLTNYLFINFYDKIRDNTSSIFQNRFNLIPATFNKISISDTIDNNILKDTNNFNTDYVEIKSNKCCLVKKLLNDNGNFEYSFSEYKDLDCDLNNFELDQNNQLFFDGINDWSNKFCSSDNSNLGSCKHFDFECIDFVSKDKCNEYNNRMPPDPLNRKITFEWQKTPCYQKMYTVYDT